MIAKEALICYLQEARRLLRLYGFAHKHDEQGLMPYVAVGLTALPPESMHFVAAVVAAKGSAGGPAAFPESCQAFKSLYERHLIAVRAALEKYVGPGYVLVHSSEGVTAALSELEEAGE